MAKKNEERFRCWVPEETRKHLREARKQSRESLRALFPPEFVQRRRAARKEMLLAARSLIDHTLERMEAEEGA